MHDPNEQQFCTYIIMTLWKTSSPHIYHNIYNAVIAAAIYLKNTWQRIKSERNRRKQKNPSNSDDPWLFPNWSWIRYSFFCGGCLYLSWMLYFDTTQFIPIGFILFSISGWIECTVQSATFLAINHAMQNRNPKGYVFITIFSIIITANCLTFMLYTPYNDEYNLFWITHWSIYILVEISIGLQYQFAASKLVCNRSTASSGFQEFKEMFVRPFFRFIYQTYNIVIIGFTFLFMTLLQLNHNQILYQWILPCIVSMRIYFLHLQQKPSRPNLCNCVIVKCWVPFVNHFYERTKLKYGDNSQPSKMIDGSEL